MKLSQRRIGTFCGNISWSNNQTWTALSETSSDLFRVMARKIQNLASQMELYKTWPAKQQYLQFVFCFHTVKCSRLYPMSKSKLSLMHFLIKNRSRRWLALQTAASKEPCIQMQQAITRPKTRQNSWYYKKVVCTSLVAAL